MRGFHFFCLLLTFVLISYHASGAPHKKSQPQPREHIRTFKHRVHVLSTGNASCKENGMNWRKLRPNEYMSGGVEIITGGLAATVAAGDQDQVKLTIYPNSDVVVDSLAGGSKVTLVNYAAYPNSEVTVEEDLARHVHGRPTIYFLSAFRVFCGIDNLTLGGHGTSYTVKHHFNGQGVLKGADVWENDDPLTSNSVVDTFVSGTYKSFVATGLHKWVDAAGTTH